MRDSRSLIAVYFLKFFKRHRDSSLPKRKPRSILFMTATVREDAEPCWQPGNSSDS